ncbi:MAG TPA: hypothetical protein VNY08_20045 [Bradyrhizobium sp.]|nr:hypothetical protein [Bradyrhizobium sp.]
MSPGSFKHNNPGAKPRSFCHDWINIWSILGEHRFVEIVIQTGAEDIFLDIARKDQADHPSLLSIPANKAAGSFRRIWHPECMQWLPLATGRRKGLASIDECFGPDRWGLQT